MMFKIEFFLIAIIILLQISIVKTQEECETACVEMAKDVNSNCNIYKDKGQILKCLYKTEGRFENCCEGLKCSVENSNDEIVCIKSG